MTDDEPLIVSVDALREDGKVLKHFNIPVELPQRPPKAISRNSFIKTLPLKKRYQQRLVPKYSLDALERIRRRFSRNILKQMLQEPKKKQLEKSEVDEGPLDLSNGHHRDEIVFKKPENPRVVFVPARAPAPPPQVHSTHQTVPVRRPDQNQPQGIFPQPPPVPRSQEVRIREVPVALGANFYPPFPTEQQYKFPEASYLRKTMPQSAAVPTNYRSHHPPPVSYFSSSSNRVQRIQPVPYPPPPQNIYPQYYYPSSSSSGIYRPPPPPPAVTDSDPNSIKYPSVVNYYPYRTAVYPHQYLPPQSVQQKIPTNCQRMAPYPTAVEKTHHHPPPPPLEPQFYIDSRIAVPKPAFCEDIPVYRVRNPYYPNNYHLPPDQETPANTSSYYPHGEPQC